MAIISLFSDMVIFYGNDGKPGAAGYMVKLYFNYIKYNLLKRQ